MSRAKENAGWASRTLDVSVSDPEDARRRRLLNIILAGVFVSSIAVLLTTAVSSIFGWMKFTGQEIVFILESAAAMVVGSFVIYLVNRRVSGFLASGIFIVLLLLILPFADNYHELANGRSLFLFVIPIIIAAFLIGSKATFIVYFLCAAEMILLASLIDETPNTIAIVTIFMLALVSWLSSRSLEQALRELRQINVELDLRVEERTRELSAALARELAEAGKSQAILEGIADGVIVFDTRGRAIVANPSIGRLLDRASAEIIGKNIGEILLSEKTLPTERETVIEAIQKPQKNIPSVRFRWGGLTLLANAAPVRTGLNETIGTVAVFRDFTREAEVEQMKNTFVAMISHELRTPLNSILGYAEMMREAVYGDINPRQMGVMERVESSSKRLLGMVSDLLDQAQLESGRMRIHESEFKTSDLAETLHATMDKVFDDKNLSLEIEIAPDMPPALRGDFHRLQQILINLVGNASKFTEKGGVRVSLFRADDSFWGMKVSDTGPGIPVEAQPYIFESFRQADNVVTRKHGGIGLGLSIVRSLVQAMGGKIELNSKLGEGSTFTTLLPFIRRKEEK